jgi:hypothetical protein
MCPTVQNIALGVRMAASLPGDLEMGVATGYELMRSGAHEAPLLHLYPVQSNQKVYN